MDEFHNPKANLLSLNLPAHLTLIINLVGLDNDILSLNRCFWMGTG